MKWIKYGLPALISLVLTGLYTALQLPVEAALHPWLRVLCDGFTLTGLLLTLTALLLWLTGKGALNGLGYALQYVLRALIPGMAARPAPSYYDYARRPRRSLPVAGCLAAGLADLAIALLLLALYYT